MGKKSRIKNRTREITQKGKPLVPDDYLQCGPIDLTRFGKLVLVQTHLSGEQFAKVQEKFAERFPEVCRSIDDKVSRIAETVKNYPPEELLKRAYWEMALKHIGVKSESELDHEAVVSLRMIDYIQSVIAGVKPLNITIPEVSEENWAGLKILVRDLFTELNSEYQICRTAYARKTDPYFDIDYDEYYFKAQLYWCNVRGERYLVHNLPFFRSVLTPHDGILKELFGVSSEYLLNALKQLQDSLTHGLEKLKSDLRQFQEVTLNEIENITVGQESLPADELPKLMTKVIKDNAWGEWRDDVFGRLLGLDLFDLRKITNLPQSLLDELSWSAGQETNFFAEGRFKGWPLRIWPIFERPFLKIGNGYYCFELFNLCDNLYRALQRVIFSKKPEYISEWNRKQKEISELIPCTLFERLLPGAKIYRTVYYRWHPSSGSPKQWCEVDALIAYEDHLFILEVKAGAFTYTPPATDFPAYIESLKNLITKPTLQGRRFLDYLQSSDEISLFDSNHDTIAKISKSSYEHITICAVTLDPLTELASKAEHLGKIGIEVGEQPVWPLSVSDLMIYADVFDSPLTFLHYVQQRMLAFKTKLITAEDELDHLGLYLKHNYYSQYAKDLYANGHIMWHGYRSEIDDYFDKKLCDPDAESPLKQEMPARLKDIVAVLSKSNRVGRRKVSSILLDCSGEWRSLITSGIDAILEEQSRVGCPKPRTTHGDTRITLFCWQKGALERDQILARAHARAAMLITDDADRLLLELFFDETGSLIDVDYEFLRYDEIPEQELPRLREKAEALRIRRLNAAMNEKGKIERNDKCPCGSGKKFKKCCGLS